ncbi:hypothetical protein [Nocardioides antri]|uniref:Tape measure protein n=1 Tax=Nocardioides antri TaxID=2607659 RepID=A0A5B1M2S2_9ACTN|nr:hypothetical protein [Nocardioides antri]KAA1426459.1 hypothetical protein F0U47_13735 [Nocardioides antri]
MTAPNVRSATVRLNAEVAKYIADMKAAGKATNDAFDSAHLQVSRVDRDLGKLTASTRDYSTSTRVAARDSLTLTTNLDRTSRAIDRYSGRLGLALRGVTALSPAVTGLIATAAPALTTLANLFAASAAGGASSIIAFQGVGNAIEAVEKARLDPTVENLAEARRQLEDLSPAAATFALRIDELVPALKRVRDSAAGELFPGVLEATDDFERALPQIRGFVSEYASVVGDLVASSSESLTSDRWTGFYRFLQGEARPALTAITEIVGDLGHGLSELWMAFDPLNDDVTQGLVNGADAFDRWASSVDKTEGFQEFLDYIDKTGPLALDTLTNIADAALQIAEATAPLSGPALTTLSNFFDIIAAIADSPIGAALLTYAAAASAAALASKGFSAAGGPALLSNLRAQSSAVQMLNTDLRTLASGYVMSASAGRRELDKYNAALARTRATLARFGKGAGLAAGVAAISTGWADSMGVANTATLGLTGAMIGGAPGAVAGGLIGAVVDVRAELARGSEEAKAFNRSLATTDLSQAIGAYKDLGAQIRETSEGMETFGWDVIAQGLGSRVTSEGFITPLEEDIANWEAQVHELNRIGDIMRQTFDDASMLRPKREVGDDGLLWDLDKLGAAATRLKPALDNLDLTWEDLANIDNSDWQASAEISGKLRAELIDLASVDVGDVAASIRELDNELLSASERAAQFGDTLSALLDPNVNLSAQTDAWIMSLRELNGELSDNSNTLKGNGNAALQNRAAIRDRVEQLKETLVAQAEAGAGSRQLSRSLQRQRDALIEAGVAAGLSGKELRGYLDTLGLTPKLVRTIIEAVGVDRASARVRAIQHLIDNYGLTRAEAQALLRDMASGKVASVQQLINKYGLTRAEARALLDDLASGKLARIIALLNSVDGRHTTSSHTHTNTITTYHRTQHVPGTGSGGLGPIDPTDSAGGGFVPKDGGPYADRFRYVLAPGEGITTNRHGETDRSRRLIEGINAGVIDDRILTRAPGAAKGAIIPGGRSTLLTTAKSDNRADEEVRRETENRKRLNAQLKEETRRRDHLVDKMKQIESSVRSALTTDLGSESGDVWTSEGGGTLAGNLAILRADTREARRMRRFVEILEEKGFDGPALADLLSRGDLNEIASYAEGSRRELNRLEQAFAERARVLTVVSREGADAALGDRLDRANAELREATRELRQIKAQVKRNGRDDRRDNQENRNQQRRGAGNARRNRRRDG